MLPHHEESISNVSNFFQQNPEVLSVLLGGSLAHGFAGSDSDVDIMIVVSDDAYQQHVQNGTVHYLNGELCTYPGGYVDGKYLGLSFLNKVAESGSEPARFAFQDSKILFSRVNGMEETIRRITRYPQEKKLENIRRFCAQFESWYWYTNEALKKNNRYLLGLSISKMVLFGSRMILAHNEMIYPYHKWLLRVLEKAEDKPADLLQCIHRLHDDPSRDNIKQYYDAVKNHREWEMPPTGWPGQFVVDSEWNWLHGMTPVDDL